jgi:hypothetical protein
VKLFQEISVILNLVNNDQFLEDHELRDRLQIREELKSIDIEKKRNVVHGARLNMLGRLIVREYDKIYHSSSQMR